MGIYKCLGFQVIYLLFLSTPFALPPMPLTLSPTPSLFIPQASMVWIIGEYAERIDNADELLGSFLESFPEENSLVGEAWGSC